MRDVFPFLVGGEWRRSENPFEVRYPYDSKVAFTTFCPSAQDVEEALQAAWAGFQETRRLPTYARAAILQKAVALLHERREEIAEIITYEGGRPYKGSLGEVERACTVFEIAAEEAKRIEGAVIPLDMRPGDEGMFAIWRRFPIGPVLCITPFNRPLNLVAHKVAPAIAAGNPVVLKPATKTPLTPMLLSEILLEAGFPPRALSILPVPGSEAEALARDDRIHMVTFTGSVQVGWRLREQVTRKRLTLELGGNAGAIVHEDADLDSAARKLSWAGFYYSGQACISVQRIFVHASVRGAFEDAFITRTKALKVGDPFDAETDISSMIDLTAAERAEAWVQEAVNGGARVLVGGIRDGSIMHPTALTNTNRTMKVRCREAFAPLVVIEPYEDFDQALGGVNDTPFGLQAAIFTNDLRLVLKAYETLEVGGVIVNNASTYRGEHMPYGGTKDSGIGREGPRYAIEEMTESKLLVM